MNQRTLLPAAGAFVGAAVLAFFGGQAIGGGSAPPADLPTFATSDPIVIPLDVPLDEDPHEFAVALAGEIEESRMAASEIDAPYTSPANGGFIETATEADDAESDTAEGEDSPVPPAPLGGSPPADDRAVDLCVLGDDGIECPEGVAGTILLAIRDEAPLAAVVAVNPSAPGEAFWFSAAVCPPESYVEGETLIGISTNRPVGIDIEYRQGRWTGSGYEVDGRLGITTDASAEAAWNEWFADETLSDRVPEAWIQHCISVDLPPRNGYGLYVRVTDAHEPGDWVRASPFPLNFDVTFADGTRAGERRRPTTLLGFGIDDLRVGVTSTPEQDVVAVAVPDLTPGVCDTAGSDRAVIDREDAVAGREISNIPMESAILDHVEYPWFRDHSRSIVSRLELTEGTDYTLCIYWFDEGPSFDSRVIEISEAIVLGTPEAYRPRLILEDLTNLFGELESITVNPPECDRYVTDDLVIDRSAGWDWVSEPVDLCSYDSGLTELDRGIRLDVGITHSDGTGAGHRPFIRTDLECGPTCLLKVDQIAVVPLPAVPTERRLCGTGFGGGCDSDVPMRSAGDAVIRIVYDHVPGNGRSEWSFGEAVEVDQTPGELGEIPLVDVDVTYELRDGDPGFGARANVTVVADRPVTLRVEATQLEEDCGIFGAPPYDSAELASTHEFSLDTLCLGTSYRLLVSGQDGAGTDLVVVPDRFGERRPFEDINVPPVFAQFDMAATVIAPNDDDRYSVELRPIHVVPTTVEPPYGTLLDWSITPQAQSDARSAQWYFRGTYGSIITCGGDDTGPLVVDARYTRGALLGQESIRLVIEADVWRLHPIGGIYGECARDYVANPLRIEATVSLVDLREGITLTSTDGSLEVTLQVNRWRAELIG